MRKITKLYKIFRQPRYYKALFSGVAAAVEHESLLRSICCKTIIDIGANRGQFSLVARHCFRDAQIFAFEPLSKPCEKFRTLFSDDKNVILHDVAVGPENGSVVIHISARDDSSSLLPITALQEALFPGTNEKTTESIRVRLLDAMIRPAQITTPAMLKLDVQGYELQALKGCENLLRKFQYVYAECSFVELYQGQALADEVISFLHPKGFALDGVYNTDYDLSGRAIQSDLLFRKE